MNTKTLEKFAQTARRQLHDQVRARLTRVLQPDSVESREKPKVVTELQRQIAATSRDAVVEQVAYTWFNRFCALRYMDANRYTRRGVVSPAAGSTQPEILQEAKQGQFDPDMPVDKQRVLDLLNGHGRVDDPQQAAYRLLLVAACNQWHDAMPFMFEKIDDYSELLMPDDLLSANSILQATRDALTEAACQDVEVIGWLYQFYISEKKDAVIGAKKAIKAQDIPAATQLFTPHWIVRYLVENSLGRLWLLNRPHSKLAEQMAFYIAPEEVETDFLRVTSPEALRLCDPAVGSGHILTYAFDLLYAIYEEEGYTRSDIPRLILQHNLVGLEIDDRAAALAAFALTMKARAQDRRFFRRADGPQPQITRLKPLTVNWSDIARAPWLRAQSAHVQDALQYDLGMLRQLDNIGSLLRPQLTATEIATLRQSIRSSGDMFSSLVMQALNMLEPLARRYHVVVANPPYMGGKGMNAPLKKFAGEQYGRSKSDLFAMFIERNVDLAQTNGYVGMITMQSWMFLSSYEKLRARLLKQETIIAMAHLGARAFDTIGGEVVSTTAFVLQNAKQPDYKGSYHRLIDGNSEAEKSDMLLSSLPTTHYPLPTNFFRASASDFKKIPGSPIAYWVSPQFRHAFQNTAISQHFRTRLGLSTANNDRFLRLWTEVSHNLVGWDVSSRAEAKSSGIKWFPYEKGGEFRKWYGNHDYLVNWQNDGSEVRTFGKETGRIRSHNYNLDYIFREGITWSDITSATNAFRFMPKGFLFDGRGSSGFVKGNVPLLAILGVLNSRVVRDLILAINPTLSVNVGEIAKLPYPPFNTSNQIRVKDNARRLLNIHKMDWDQYETSWEFSTHPIRSLQDKADALAQAYASTMTQRTKVIDEVKALEEESNSLIIDAFDLDDELNNTVPFGEITLISNPYARYGSAAIDEKQLKKLRRRWPQVVAQWPQEDIGIEQRLLADTLREFISYAVGCMFGRYSLDKPGLILANQGETVADYVRIVGREVEGREIEHREVGDRGVGQRASSNYPSTNYPSTTTFAPDDDNVIPILDGDWFEDDIAERFKRFLRVTFGDQNYDDNLAFIETAIGRDIRSYFLRDFYDFHVKMYKKRPIYWLFSSPKGSFNALIYMHRYRPDTASTVLEYLRDFRSKLQARRQHLETVSISVGASSAEKTRALKEVANIDKMIADADTYERDILYPLATKQIDIDLDDGVLVNYNRFGKALKKITGVTGKPIPDWAKPGNRV